jgi:glycosyltransferase involved in cell wall biosynthesis
MYKPLISVIIPCRNGINYLAEAVSSIHRQNLDVEIIVVDDGSTDNTVVFAQSLNCTVVSIPASGLSAARNVGIRTAKGDYLMFLDHDDVLIDNSLKCLLSVFTGSIDFVSARVMDFISPELPETEKEKLAPRKEPYGGLLTGAYLFRRNVFEKSGTFDEKLQTGQGVDFLLRCSNAGLREEKLDFVAAGRRLHNTNMGRILQKQENKDYTALLRARLIQKNIRMGKKMNTLSERPKSIFEKSCQ